MNIQYTKKIKNSKCKNYANKQNAKYISNQILYGINNNIDIFGVSDGTCKQIDPLIYNDKNKCGFGLAGGNPCYTTENFQNYTQNKLGIANIIILFLIILFIYTTVYFILTC